MKLGKVEKLMARLALKIQPSQLDEILACLSISRAKKDSICSPISLLTTLRKQSKSTNEFLSTFQDAIDGLENIRNVAQLLRKFRSNNPHLEQPEVADYLPSSSVLHRPTLGQSSYFHKTLIKISNDLTRKHLEIMVLLSPTPEAQKENIVTGIQLFEEMERHGCISENDTELLDDLFGVLKLKTPTFLLADYKKEHPPILYLESMLPSAPIYAMPPSNYSSYSSNPPSGASSSPVCHPYDTSHVPSLPNTISQSLTLPEDVQFVQHSTGSSVKPVQTTPTLYPAHGAGSTVKPVQTTPTLYPARGAGSTVKPIQTTPTLYPARGAGSTVKPVQTTPTLYPARGAGSTVKPVQTTPTLYPARGAGSTVKPVQTTPTLYPARGAGSTVKPVQTTPTLYPARGARSVFVPPLQVMDQTSNEDVHRAPNWLPSLSHQASSPSPLYFNNLPSPHCEGYPSDNLPSPHCEGYPSANPDNRFSVGTLGCGVSATPTAPPIAAWSGRELCYNSESQHHPLSCEENTVSCNSTLNTNETYQNQASFPSGQQVEMTPHQECGAVNAVSRPPEDRCLTKSKMMKVCNKGKQVMSLNQTATNPVQEANDLLHGMSTSKVAQETGMLNFPFQRSQLEGNVSEQNSRKRKIAEEMVTRSTAKKQRPSMKAASKSYKKSSKSWFSTVLNVFRPKVSEEPETDSEEYETCDEDDIEID